MTEEKYFYAFGNKVKENFCTYFFLDKNSFNSTHMQFCLFNKSILTQQKSKINSSKYTLITLN